MKPPVHCCAASCARNGKSFRGTPASLKLRYNPPATANAFSRSANCAVGPPAFGAWVSALRGRSGDADRYAFAVQHSEYEGPMPDGSPSTRPWAALVRAMLCNCGVETMLADAELALDELSETSFWRPPALLRCR